MGRSLMAFVLAFVLTTAGGAAAQCIDVPEPPGNAFFAAGFESDANAFTLTGRWHHETGCSVLDADHPSDGALYFGLAGCTYGTDSTEAGTATSPPISLAGRTPPLLLTFRYKLDADMSPPFDRAEMQLSSDNVSYHVALDNDPATPPSLRLCNTDGPWRFASVDVSDYAGGTLYVRVVFNSQDATFFTNEGFYVDDVNIRALGADRECGFRNPDFEYGLTAWNASVNTLAAQPWETGYDGSGPFFDGVASSGALFAQHPFNGPDGTVYEAYQEFVLPDFARTAYLTWNGRIKGEYVSSPPSLPRVSEVVIGPAGGGGPETVVFSEEVPGTITFDTGYRNHGALLNAIAPELMGQTVRVTWRQSVPEQVNGTALFSLDDVCVDFGCGSALSGTLEAASPHWNRPQIVQDVYSACDAPAVDSTSDGQPYAVFPVQSDGSAAFTATVLPDETTAEDTLLFLYCEFDPLAPLANMLAANDDTASSLLSGIGLGGNINLTPGETYYLVVTTFDPGDQDGGDFNICLGAGAFRGACGPFEPGARVKSLVDNPGGSTCIAAGQRGTLVCPANVGWTPGEWLVQFDGIDCGHAGELATGGCGVTPATTGWYMFETDMEIVCGEECLPGSEFQQPLGATPGINAGNPGDEFAAPLFERYTMVSGPIRSLRWWAYSKDLGNAPCNRASGQFRIDFHADNAGSVGALTASHTVTATAAPVDFFPAFPLVRYDAELGAPVNQLDGWISVVALGDSACQYFWNWAELGPGLGKYFVDPVFVDTGHSFALCLSSVGSGSSSHTADQNADNAINLSELLRVIQFYNSANYGCEAGTEDGYQPNDPDTGCVPHSSDYNPQDWDIALTELLRLIQFYNSGGYHPCPEGEDGFCPGL